METDTYLFIGEIPIQVDKKRLGRQHEIEFWLDSTPYLKALGLPVQTTEKEKCRGYIV